MGIIGTLYAGCAVAFLGLISLMAMRGRISGTGAAITACCALTVGWAAAAARDTFPPSAAAILDSMRLSAWLIFSVALVYWRDGRRTRRSLFVLPAVIGFCLAAVGSQLLRIDQIASPGALWRLTTFFHLGFGVFGLLAIENLWRNADGRKHYHVWPFCLALGGMFAFELFLYADRLIAPGVGPVVASGRAVVGLFSVPLLAVAMARNREWRVDIHVSRSIVFHSAALVASGVFFLALAGAAIMVRGVGEHWGPMLQLAALLGSAIVLASVLGIRDLRSSLKRAVARNFFSHRYDYRAEWLRFIDTISTSRLEDQGLSSRVVKALAQIVESPGGTLWRLGQKRTYACEASWNIDTDKSRGLAADDIFIAGFRDGTWIQERSQVLAAWPDCLAEAWLAIPLIHGGDLIAFVVLTAPRVAYSLDWEAYDLLRAAGRQAASYLAEEHAASALADARLFAEFNKRFAFVAHDIKNLANQLGLIAANAQRHLGNPEFQEDMLETVQNSVARMNKLLAQLRTDTDTCGDGAPRPAEPDVVVAELARELSAAGTLVETRLRAGRRKTAIDGDLLRSALSHLICNAAHAAPGEVVVVSSRCTEDQLIIEVVDRGPGMDDAFIRWDLFKPFSSTKSDGFGIGAYQTRELLRVAGGDLEVISERGVGTTMRITLPVSKKTGATVATP